MTQLQRWPNGNGTVRLRVLRIAVVDPATALAALHQGVELDRARCPGLAAAVAVDAAAAALSAAVADAAAVVGAHQLAAVAAARAADAQRGHVCRPVRAGLAAQPAFGGRPCDGTVGD